MIKFLKTFLFVLLFSCEAEKSFEVNYYSNGQIASMGPLVNNKMNGYWVHFERDGKVHGHGNYRDNKEEGKWIFYRHMGAEITEYNFVDGLVDGLIVRTSTLGDTFFIVKCREGIREYVEYENFGQPNFYDSLDNSVDCICPELLPEFR